MVRKTDHLGRAIEAALELAAARGWRRVALTDVAGAAGLTLVELYRVSPSKAALLAGYARRLDEQMLTGEEEGAAEEPPRDRLFEVLMRRFESMRPHRDGLAAILADLPTDPLAALCTLPGFARSMAWALVAAGLSPRGLCGLARIKVLGAVYLATLRVWLRDEDADMAATMAALDRNLRCAERWTWLTGWTRREYPRPEEEASEPA